MDEKSENNSRNIWKSAKNLVSLHVVNEKHTKKNLFLRVTAITKNVNNMIVR